MSELRFDHALLIGATGMLADAARWVVERSRRAVVVGRNGARLRAVAAAGAVTMLHADVRRTSELQDGLECQTAAHGPFDLALVWLHGDANAALPIIAQWVGGHEGTGRMVIALGCEAEDPSLGGEEPEQSHAVPGIRTVESVVLGFIRRGGNSRWLTHEEISRGAIDAMNSGRRRTIVGVVAPWSEHPPL